MAFHGPRIIPITSFQIILGLKNTFPPITCRLGAETPRARGEGLNGTARGSSLTLLLRLREGIPRCRAWFHFSHVAPYLLSGFYSQRIPVSARRNPTSVIFEVAHPFRPVFRLDAGGFGPLPARVEVPVPFQRPEFFNPHLPH